MSNKLKIEYVPIDSINPYPNNAKLHPAEQIAQIKKSIEEFGMNDPIGVWGDEVVEGHGRLTACKELGFNEVPVIRLDGLDDEQRRAYMLVHNQLTMNSGFDLELLDLELRNIDIDMSQFGFESEVVIDNELASETDNSFNYVEQYGVIVMCGDEKEQEETYNHLVEEGYECKVVAV